MYGVCVCVRVCVCVCMAMFVTVCVCVHVCVSVCVHVCVFVRACVCVQGEMSVSPACFAHFVNLLKPLAAGRIALLMEVR